MPLDQFRRREFIGLLGGGANRMATRGARSASDAGDRGDALLQRLREEGYVEGQTVLIEYRSASGAYERLSCHLVRRGRCGECTQCLDNQVALGFCRRKQIDVSFCRSGVSVERWQNGNLFRQLARRLLEGESHGAFPFLLAGGPTAT
jgi:hypothetical protein